MFKFRLNKNQQSLYIVPFQEFNKLKRKCNLTYKR